jgi:hypothetical protein
MIAHWAYQPGTPTPERWSFFRQIDGGAIGFDAVVLQNNSNGSYYFAVAGTNEGSDVLKWPSAVIGYSGNKD